jgi:hypothetical protein
MDLDRRHLGYPVERLDQGRGHGLAPATRQGTSYVVREGTKRLDVHRVRGELSAQGNLGYRRIAEGDELVLRRPVGLVRHLGFKST